MRTVTRLLVFFLTLATVSLPSLLVAQTFRGTLLGTVTDPTGAVIPGAAISVKNMDTGIERTTESNSDGAFTVPELPVGRYSITVNMTGFNAYQADGLEITVGSQVNLNVALQTGGQKEEVVVSASALQVETTSNTLGATLTTQDVKNLPVNGRDYTKLIYLSPGVTGSPDQISDSPGSFGAFSVNGARGRSNNFLLDGTDMNDGYRNDPAVNEPGVFGAPATILPIDAVSELRVLSNYEPEYGRSAGGIINIVTKSGTNDFHGTAAEYFRNNALDARNYFNPGDKRRPHFITTSSEDRSAVPSFATVLFSFSTMKVSARALGRSARPVFPIPHTSPAWAARPMQSPLPSLRAIHGPLRIWAA